MYRGILIALAVMIAMTGAVAAQGSGSPQPLPIDYVQAWTSSNPRVSGQAWSGPVEIYWTSTKSFSRYQRDSISAKLPVKFRVSWTPNKKWLSWKKSNPSHNRRGNKFVEVPADFDWNADEDLGVRVNMALPAGKSMRIRVRPIYADKSRGEDCIVTLQWTESGYLEDWLKCS